MAQGKRTWWKDATIYQIWPASYKDSNGDGIGDIPGIISTLDYIKELGTDVIWLSPSYKSPQKDMGYDISDYEDIDPQYGTLADADQLIKEVHARGMKIIFDLVINHTSDQHAWFQESRSSKTNPKRDWYIWRPARYDANGKRQPPNNWRPFLGGGSAWEWDEETQEYYLHLFVKEQPDLNWENVATRKAIFDSAVLFWLKRGVDGFRIDTVNMYSKPSTFVDGPIKNPEEQYQLCPEGFINGPRMHEYLSELYAVMEPYDTMTVGELPFTPTQEKLKKYVSASQKQMDMVFQFEVTEVAKSVHEALKADPVPLGEFKTTVAFTQQLAADSNGDAWSTAFLENHDVPRSVSRFATDAPEHRTRAAKLLATMLATLSGTLFLYQGQELGMANAPRSWGTEEYKDVGTYAHFEEAAAKYPGDQARIEKLLDGAQMIARDHARTPVQWTPGPNAGFTAEGVTPWMRVNDDWKEYNAETERADPNSILSFWKEALKVRKGNKEVCVYGGFDVLPIGKEQVFAYVKDGRGEGKICVVLNFTSERQVVGGFGSVGTLGEVILGNVPDKERESGSADEVVLLPWESRVYVLGQELAN